MGYRVAMKFKSLAHPLSEEKCGEGGHEATHLRNHDEVSHNISPDVTQKQGS